jgi:hypothetical protein
MPGYLTAGVFPGGGVRVWHTVGRPYEPGDLCIWLPRHEWREFIAAVRAGRYDYEDLPELDIPGPIILPNPPDPAPAGEDEPEDQASGPEQDEP